MYGTAIAFIYSAVWCPAEPTKYGGLARDLIKNAKFDLLSYDTRVESQIVPIEPPKTRRNPTQRVKDGPLTEADWVAAATDILVEENVRGIKLDRLCAKLGVTKGSFYWHFKKRSDLLAAMLVDWRRRMTLNAIRSVSRGARSGLERLQHMLGRPRHPDANHFAAVEMSFRDWARRVETTRDAILEVDRIRIEFFEHMFIDEGFSPDESRRRAYLAYCLLMGDAVLNKTLRDYLPDGEYVESALRILTAKPAPAER